MYSYLLSFSLLVVTAAASCSDKETNKASQEFKDCVDKKEFELIHMDRNQEDVQSFICDKLEEISSDCHRALAKCRSREYVDDKVAIHINSISGKKNHLLLLSFLNLQKISHLGSLVLDKEKPRGQQIFCQTPGNISHSGSL